MPRIFRWISHPHSRPDKIRVHRSAASSLRSFKPLGRPFGRRTFSASITSPFLFWTNRACITPDKNTDPCDAFDITRVSHAQDEPGREGGAGQNPRASFRTNPACIGTAPTGYSAARLRFGASSPGRIRRPSCPSGQNRRASGSPARTFFTCITPDRSYPHYPQGRRAGFVQKPLFASITAIPACIIPSNACIIPSRCVHQSVQCVYHSLKPPLTLLQSVLFPTGNLSF